jgi:hypothetical protein
LEQPQLNEKGGRPGWHPGGFFFVCSSFLFADDGKPDRTRKAPALAPGLRKGLGSVKNEEGSMKKEKKKKWCLAPNLAESGAGHLVGG